VDFEKEHKIRIVEKLGTMKTALGHDDANNHSGLWPTLHGAAGMMGLVLPSHLTGAMQTSNNSSPREHSTSDAVVAHPVAMNNEAVKWLDDQELSEMSTEDLEVIMDRYIMEVVRQLVQLAALDDDLRAEIDSLDTSGFSLLHYCCLYNLNSLIPVLLARGADVNRRTSTGSTALHLAAGAGHLAVTQVLVASGAVVDSYDANNVLPSDAAYEAGFMDIYNLLLSVRIFMKQFYVLCTNLLVCAYLICSWRIER
jgi:ankyrin repeat protein